MTEHRPSRGATVEARGLSKVYRSADRETPVLSAVDLKVAAGELVGIVGPSGSGKSTLLHLLGALDRPDAGEVLLDDLSLARLDPDALAEVRNRKVGFVFQFHHLLPDFTALENVALPARIAGSASAETEARARQLVERVGLSRRAEHYPNQLSGGERQRIALCRALALRPSLVLADEPTGNLDSASGDEVMELLEELQSQEGTTAIVVTHNPEIAGRCGRILELVDGSLHESERSPDAPSTQLKS